ncbi:MAG: hypothetical protein IPK16_27085 [Anaerolineales bacterium]|nr:hypothetical protein [Anaerolineales bacterium]
MADPLGGLPLAVELVGGYLGMPSRSKLQKASRQAIERMGSVAERMALAKRRLGSLTGEVETLEAVLRLSIEDLGRTNPDCEDVFYALGAFAPKPASFDVDAAAVVAGADTEKLGLLVARNLVEITEDSELAVHQVVHALATPATQKDASVRHSVYYMAQVDRDRANWRHIESIWPQIRYAWEQIPDDSERLVTFMGQSLPILFVEGFVMNIFHGRAGSILCEGAW